MGSTAKIIGKVKRGVEKVAYGNPLYQKLLAIGTSSDRLIFTPPDLWPGNAHAGMDMMAAQHSMFGHASDITNAYAAATELRNLRAVGTDAARHMAVAMIASRMAQCETWNDRDWHPATVGARLAAWVGFYDFYADAAPTGFIPRLADHLHRQWKHLVRAVPAQTEGVAGMDIARGLIYGALNFGPLDSSDAGAERTLGLACDVVRRQLVMEIYPDGTHRTRNPSVHLAMVQRLLDIRAVFNLAGLPLPDEVTMAIASMTPVLKFYRHGDGALALFHGSAEESALVIDATLTQAEVKGRMPRRLTHGGYERMTAGRSWLLADVAAPSAEGHAGLAAFEFGQGKERIIVNCGGYNVAAWKAAMAATAAHTTLTVDDTNAVEVLPTGGVRGAVHVTAQRYERDTAQIIDIRHDGYFSHYGVTHQRELELSADGDVLRGTDVLEGTGGRNYALRWHIHPAVQVALTQGGQAALFKTASGAGWRLRIEDTDHIAMPSLILEPSIYCGHGEPRRTMQLKLAGVTQSPATRIIWMLTREKK